MENRSNAKLAFGIATFIVSAAIILSAIFADKWLNSLALQVWITFGGILFASWGITYAALLFPATYADWWGHMAYAEAKRTEAYTAKLGRGENVTKSVTNETETKTDPDTIIEAEWRDYYTDIACIAKTEGGLAYRKKFEKYMSNAQWSATVRDALCEAKVAVKINYPGGESADWRPGWNSDTFAGWLVGNLPPHPNEHPPKLDRAVQADKKYTGKQDTYNGSQADTVYAKDV